MTLLTCIRHLRKVGQRRRILESQILWRIQKILLLILIFHKIRIKLVSLVFQKILILQMVDRLENRGELEESLRTKMTIVEWIQTHQLETDKISPQILIQVDFIQQT